jgi:hypothetical protein
MADGTLIITYNGDTERAFRLVGAFMHHWANIELALDRAVRAVLRLGQTEGLVATANLTFPGKVRVITTALGQASAGPGWAKDGSDVLKTLTALYDDRVMVAHDGFAGVPGGVVFYKLRTQGASKFPETSWSEAEFEKKYDSLRDLATKLVALIERLEKGALALDPLPALSPTPAVKAAQSAGSRSGSAVRHVEKPKRASKPAAKSRKSAPARRRRVIEVKKPTVVAAVAPAVAPSPTPASPGNGSNVQPLPSFGTPRPIV